MKKTIFLLSFCLSLSYSFAQKPAIRSGPMPGYTHLREAAIWLQTTEAAQVQLNYWPVNEPAKKKTTATATCEKKTAFTAKLIADEVEPGTTYQYEVLINGKKFSISDRLEFHTPPLWQWRTDPPAIKFVVGSCAYVNETVYDRPGTPYGGDYRIFDTIAAIRPNFMLWLGDNTYLREVDWFSRTGILARNTHTRSLPDLQKLLRSTHHYAIWDDHDFGPNNSDRSFPGKEWTEEAFNLFWANPNTNLTGQGGITTFFQYGDCDFYLLDDRWFRSPNNAGPENKQMLGKAQIDLMLEAMMGSPSPFKFVAVGNQVLFPKEGDENLAGFPEEKEYLLSELQKRKIRGVIFLSGDRHHTELTKLERNGSYPLYDFTCSPLTSGTHNARDEGNTLQVPGTLVNDKNYGLIEISGPRKSRSLTMKVFDLNNKLRWTYSIKEEELR